MDSDSERQTQDPGWPPPALPAESKLGRTDPVQRTFAPRDIILLNLAIAAAQDRSDELGSQIALALTNDITPTQITNVLEQAACHSGHCLDDHVNILGEALRAAGGREQR